MSVDLRPLTSLLDRYTCTTNDERRTFESLRELTRSGPVCLSRDHRPAHFTASSLVLSPDCASVLLCHHKKLGKWLQLGGHADGDADLARVALREAQEESGLGALSLLLGGAAVDADIHMIPERSGESAHEHYDLRFLIQAQTNDDPIVSAESHAVRWFSWSEIPSMTEEKSLLRLCRRGQDLVRNKELS